MRRTLTLLAAFGLLSLPTGGHADDWNLPVPDSDGTAISMYGSYYHMMNRRTVTAKAPWGRGSTRYRLIPYRSIAADHTQFPAGTVLFIPELRGKVMTAPDGTTFTHDGYVMVVDSGSGVRGHHIDFFAGNVHSNPAPLLFNGTRHHFDAYVVSDIAVVAAMATLHDPDAPLP